MEDKNLNRTNILMKKKIVSFTILFIFAILGFILLRSHASELKNILEINFKYVIILLFLRIFNPFFRGLKLKILTELYNLNLKFREWFGLTILVTFGNYLTPFRAGFSTMMIYLKKKYNFPYTYSVSLTGILYLSQFFIFGLLGFFFTFFTPFPKEFKYGIMLIFIIIFFISILMLFFIPLPIKINIKILRHIANSISEFRKARNPSFMLKMILLDASRMMILAFSFYLAFKAFDFNASFYGCILIVIFSELSLVISLTPMGLGVKESLVIIISKLMGADILTGTFVAALDRAIEIVVIFILVPIFSYLIFKKEKH